MALVIAGCSSGGSENSLPTEPPDTADQVALTAVPVETEPDTTEPVVPATEPPGLDNGRDSQPDSTEPAPTEPSVAEPAAASLPARYQGYVSEIYANEANWLCKPGIANDVCARDLDATIVNADGSTDVEEFVPASDPAVDCFYVYPTVSGDQTGNSDLIPAENEEISTVLNQAARLGATCAVYAPVYRQRTLAALLGQVETDESTRTLAYDDVLDSFKHFLANDSDGRPFVLVGHSQGSGLLSALVGEEIDGEPALRDRMVSALLLGSGVEKDGFDNLGPCTSLTDTGCIVSYASFRDTVPPPDNSFFGRTASGPAMCVNPVDPAGGAFVTKPYFRMEAALLGGGVQPFDDPARSAEITTPFVTYPDMVTAECIDNGTFGYLQLTITTNDGPRTDDVGGDLTPEWGMHLIDANVAMGDLVDLVAAQSAAFG